jgi:RNA polymerase sigma-70 factor (sigma-E family)
VAAVKREDRLAFETFVQDNGDALVRLAFGLCGDRGMAEDAVQEALTRIYLRWGRLRGEPDGGLAYSRRVVVNATRDQWRHLSRRERRELTAAGAEPPVPPEHFDEAFAERDRLVAALRRLPYGQRAVIVLRYWHQLSEQETADALGNSVGTVKSQCSRALGRLRQELEADLLSTCATEEP